MEFKLCGLKYIYIVKDLFIYWNEDIYSERDIEKEKGGGYFNSYFSICIMRLIRDGRKIIVVGVL